MTSLRCHAAGLFADVPFSAALVDAELLLVHPTKRIARVEIARAHNVHTRILAPVAPQFVVQFASWFFSLGEICSQDCNETTGAAPFVFDTIDNTV